MKEISLNILDIVQNSIAAAASLINIEINEDLINDKLTVTVIDNGRGMSNDTINYATDPFYTTRNTRRVGLGIPLFNMAAKMCDGDFKIKSKEGQGTTVCASFRHSHIDRQPIGDMASTLAVLVASNPNIDFIYTHIVNQERLSINTMEIRNKIKSNLINAPEVIRWIKEYIQEGTKILYGGSML